MFNIVHMKVNGKEVELAVDERESLLDTLRNRLGLTSVKKGCEVGECGACTVLVNGEAIDSCIYLTMWADGKSVMTVEGLKGPNGELSPIQKAFIEEAAVQCGFCTPGLIMSAVEIVGTGKKYNREELKKLISGHLCRCTGYENILNAMERIVEEVYLLVPCTPAQMSGDQFAKLIAVIFLARPYNLNGTHDQTRRTESALDCRLLDKCLLDR